MQVEYANFAILDQYLAFGSMTGEMRSNNSTVDREIVYGSQGRDARLPRRPPGIRGGGAKYRWGR